MSARRLTGLDAALRRACVARGRRRFLAQWCRRRDLAEYLAYRYGAYPV